MSAENLTFHLGRLAEAAQIIMDFAVANGAARSPSKITVKELLDEFQTAKERLGKSKRYLRQMRVSVQGLIGDRLQRPVAEVSRDDLQKAVSSLSLAPRTVRGYFLDVATLFNFAVRQEYLQRNPAKFVQTPVIIPKAPAIHTPQEVQRLLQEARLFDVNFCRELAVRYFAGIRSAEAARLTEEDIRSDYIEVKAEKSKTRRRRLVEITPNLRSWLAIGGKLPVGRVSGFGKKLAQKAGCDWPNNVTRHSWCSYHLSKFGSAARTALEAGHTEGVLFAHYREIVTRSAAEEFFNIRP